MAYGNSTSHQEVSELVKRYGMTVQQAADVPVPHGASKGRPMGEEWPKGLYWYATRIVSTHTKKPMRDAIVAARILRATRQAQRSIEKSAEAIKNTDGAHFNSALLATVECLSCGIKSVIRRIRLARRSQTKCYSCGGTLVQTGSGPIDEYMTLKQAHDELGLSRVFIQRGVEEGRIVSIPSESGRRRLYGRASLQNECDRIRADCEARGVSTKCRR